MPITVINNRTTHNKEMRLKRCSNSWQSMMPRTKEQDKMDEEIRAPLEKNHVPILGSDVKAK